MKKWIMMFVIVLLVGCSSTAEAGKESVEKWIKLTYKEKNFNGRMMDKSLRLQIVEDENTGCAYMYSSGRYADIVTALYDENGKQVGCRGIENVTTIEDYLKKKKG